MDPGRIVERIRGTGPRPACSDAERRAARMLASELRAHGRPARVETFWVRPQWPVAWLLHALLGLVGSIVAIDVPAVGLGLCAVAALSALAELGGRFGVLSLVLPRRATQNVVAAPPAGTGAKPVTLVVAAAYDSPRAPSGALRTLGRLDAAVRRVTAGLWPHPLGLLALALVLLAALAGARLAGVGGTALGAVQLAPTLVCLFAIGILVDLALASRPQPGGDAAALALQLVRALDAAPPRNLAVELVLAGASDGPALGMRHHVRSRRAVTDPEEVAVLHVEPLDGPARYWTHDGPLLPTRLHPDLVGAAEAAAARFGAEPLRGRGTTGALEARRARWPAIAVGGEGAAPLCLALIAAVDAQLTRGQPSGQVPVHVGS